MTSYEFDYIIVGAGSAGCVLANRLSADPSKRVGLIEGGGPADNWRVRMPAAILSLYGSPRYDYGYVSTPQKELNNRRIPVNRGKGLGGSSIINSMVYIRGAARDYDEWSDLGCAGWDYASVLNVFKRLEHNRLGQDPTYHGFEGELYVDKPRDPNAAALAFVRGAPEGDLPTPADFNTENPLGLGVYNVTQDRGRRFSSYAAFLKPVETRPNLTVLTNAAVETIRFDGRKATGLTAFKDGAEIEIRCREEIILSAGAIMSPTLLLRSGVGPGAQLQSAGVELVHELPGVGQNLQDHVDGMITMRSKNTETLGLSAANLPSMLAAPFRYIFGRKGMLQTNYVEAGGFARTRYANDVADIQFHFVPGYRSHRGRLVEYGHGFAVHTCVLRPHSVGEITLSPTDRSALIDQKFFSDHRDAETLVEGIKVARTLMNSKALAHLGGVEILPGPSVNTDEEILDYLRREALTVYHPAGTCKMGVDPMAVCDPASLRVNGLENVRVADASIMPRLIGGNTNAPCMMIGQRCADMVLAAA